KRPAAQDGRGVEEGPRPADRPARGRRPGCRGEESLRRVARLPGPDRRGAAGAGRTARLPGPLVGRGGNGLPGAARLRRTGTDPPLAARLAAAAHPPVGGPARTRRAARRPVALLLGHVVM